MRYYDPEAGRFISRDPLGMWGDPGQRGNAQNYCGNNPVNRVDPLGLDDSAGSAPFDPLRDSESCTSGPQCGVGVSGWADLDVEGTAGWVGGHVRDVLEPDASDWAMITGAVVIPDIGPTEFAAGAWYCGRRSPKIAGKIDDFLAWAKKATSEALEAVKTATAAKGGPQPAVAGAGGRRLPVLLSEAAENLGDAGRRAVNRGMGDTPEELVDWMLRRERELGRRLSEVYEQELRELGKLRKMLDKNQKTLENYKGREAVKDMYRERLSA